MCFIIYDIYHDEMRLIGWHDIERAHYMHGSTIKQKDMHDALFVRLYNLAHLYEHSLRTRPLGQLAREAVVGYGQDVINYNMDTLFICSTITSKMHHIQMINRVVGDDLWTHYHDYT